MRSAAITVFVFFAVLVGTTVPSQLAAIVSPRRRRLSDLE